jgi:hypothetical protein
VSGARAGAALLALATCWLAAEAHASPEHPALHWVRGAAAESCIDPRTLAQRVQSITGPSLVSAHEADVSIEARIEHDAPKLFTVHLRVSGAGPAGGEERVVAFKADDCRSLDASIAFLIAMAIDPELGADGIPKELSWVDEQDAWSTAESSRRELAAAPRRTPVQPERAPPSAAPANTLARPALPPVARAWQLMAAGVIGTGHARRLAAGLGLGLSRELLARVSIAIQVNAAQALAVRELNAARSVSVEDFDLALLACLDQPLPAALSLRGCLGPEALVLHARGHGFAPDKSAWFAAIGGAARLDLRYALDGHWALALGAVLYADLAPPEKKLYFGNDLHAPARLDRTGTNTTTDDAVRDAQRNLYVVDSAAHRVTKLEAGTGRTLWTRDDFIDSSPIDLAHTTLWIVAAALGDGRVAVAVDAPDLAAPGGAGVMFLSLLDADGNATSVPWNPATSAATLLPADDGVSVVASLNGDLQVVHVRDANHQKGVLFQRNDYTLLNRDGAASDGDGNVYVGTHSGSRDEPKPTLCRANIDDGGGSCYTLPTAIKFDQIVARKGGDVFIRSGAQLIHVAYPQ